MQIVTRNAGEADIAVMIDMGRNFWELTPYREVPYAEDSARMTIALCIENGVAVVAEIDGVVVGMLAASRAPLLGNHDYQIAAEQFWWIEPTARGSGIGRLLLEFAETLAKELGVTFWFMGALIDMQYQASSNALHSMGYRPVETFFMKEI